MKILVTGAISWNDEQSKEIEELGHEIIFIQDERTPLKAQGIDSESIEGTVCNGLFLYNDISDFKNLRYIQLTSAGFDRVPLEFIKEHKIEIHNARGVYSIPMAEFAISGVLQIYKKSHFFCMNQKQHIWKKNRDIEELFGKTVCIIGCGSVGSECAKRFLAFDCRVIGIDLCPREDVNYTQMLGIDKLEEVLSNSDIVILTLPSTDSTRHLLDISKFDLLKAGAVLVNIARGSIIDTEALIQVLPRLGGAVLDVFEEEPLREGNPLWDMENVIITPHNSFIGENNREKLFRLIRTNLAEFEKKNESTFDCNSAKPYLPIS